MDSGTINEYAGESIFINVTNAYSVYSDTYALNGTDGVFWKGEDNGVTVGDDPKDPDDGKVLVKTAWFAKKAEKKVKAVKEQDYTVADKDTHAGIARKVKGVNVKELKQSYSKLTPGAVIKLKVHGESKELSLEKLSTAIIGTKVFIVVETAGLKDVSLTIDVLGSNNTTFVKPDETVTVLAGGTEKTSLSAKVGEYADKTAEYSNAAFFVNKAIIEIELKPKEADQLKDWRKKVADSTEKQAFLHLKVKAETDKEVTYYNEDETIKEQTKDKGIYLNKKNGWFGLYACYCNRDITVDEMRAIIKEMRESEKKTSTSLFSSANCPLPDSDKTYAKLQEVINKVMKKYTINTCIRKIHFLAQAYCESDRFGTTLEYGSGDNYESGVHKDAERMENTEAGDGRRYKGRGIIQLTWRKNQRKFLEYVSNNSPDLIDNKLPKDLLDRTTQYEEKYIYSKKIKDAKGKVISKEIITEKVNVDGASLIARSLELAFDSAGWYWCNLGGVVATNENINEVADKDDVLKTSQCINGRVSHPNGLDERKTYTSSLKTLMSYANCIKNQK